jgi:tripartite-type tricarboxylate transporter receptor subunit TctC
MALFPRCHGGAAVIRRRYLLGAAALAATGPAAAQEAARPIRILVGFTPGGGTDLLVRSFSNRLAEILGQSVVVENRPGAGGNIATEAAVRAAPDGHTLVLGTVGSLIVNPVIFRDLPYDVDADLMPVALAGDIFNVLVVPAARPWRNLGELIAAAKARPGGLSWSHSGVGTSLHLAGSLFDRVAGIETVSVSYRGGAPMATDLMAGRIDYSFATAASVMSALREGRLRALAVPAATRRPGLEDVPTVAESGLPGFAVNNWAGLLAPRGTPQPAIARLDAAMRETLRDPATQQNLARNGIAPLSGGPAEFAALWQDDRQRWVPIIRASGAQPN